MNFKQYLPVFLFVATSFGIGAATGYFFGFTKEHNTLVKSLDVIHPIRESNASYKFIAPLLAYVIPDSQQEKDFLDLKNNIFNLIEDEKKEKSIFNASVFLSDLNRGRWIGVRENEKYAPASMLKVVIMVAYFKEFEKNNNILKEQLVYEASLDQLLKRDVFNSTSSLEVGKAYAIEELIDKMIIESDNGAEILLLNSTNPSVLQDIYKNLGINSPESFAGDFTISPREYSLFFRVLYSATYLRKGMSEKALEILSKTTFNDGIVAGLPESITVSHKFGERISGSVGQVEKIELHDCGIIYSKENPYFLCVMTEGEDEKALKKVIKDISALVYNHYAQ